MIDKYSDQQLQRTYHDYKRMVYDEGVYDLDDLYFMDFLKKEMEKRGLDINEGKGKNIRHYVERK